MKKPYIVFQGTRTKDGTPFPVNKWIEDLPMKASGEEKVRGNILVAKVEGVDAWRTGGIGSASMSDIPIVKNFFLSWA